MTAPHVDPEYIIRLIAQGAIGFRKPEMGKKALADRTPHRDLERERQRLKRVAFTSQGLTCIGTKRIRKAYGDRLHMTPDQLHVVQRLDSDRHMLKTKGPAAVQAKIRSHERIAQRLSAVLAGDYEPDLTVPTVGNTPRRRGTNRPPSDQWHIIDLERSHLKRRGRPHMQVRVRWHLALAERLGKVLQSKGQP